MQYGYFDDASKEYVITRPDTPKSWSNYLGNTEYGAIITNNAGGYSFYRSGGMGRFMRMRFNSIPMDQPGRYIYLHDKNKKDFWSASWQPVGKPLEKYTSTCRHGMAYTVINSEYDSIHMETTYFVPFGKAYEIWQLKLTNKDSVKRNLRGFTFVEYAANWNAIDDLLNLQYVQYISQVSFKDGMIDHGTNIYIPEMPENFKEKDQGRHTFQTIIGADITGYDTDREAFIGPYRTYSNPIVVENGEALNSNAYGDNPCGSLQFDIDLQPRQSKTILVVVGVGKPEIEGNQARKELKDISVADEELERLKKFWHGQMEGLSATTPDAELNSTINTWGIYNCLVTFAWSRAASLIYSGIDRDGLGYRDSVQDLLGVMHAIPTEARNRLELLITGQVSTGGAMPVILPFSHNPGSEKAPTEEEYRSDDCLWLFNAIPTYVKETGDIGFYNKKLPYADKGEATVLGHMRRAIEFNLERTGSHGLPSGLMADWNDCLKFGHTGETIFVAMQLRLALKVYMEASQLVKNAGEESWGKEQLVSLDEKIQKHAWDGEWFMRGYRFDGLKFGSRDVPEGQLFLNPQVWSVISEAATPQQAKTAMRKVQERLATDYGIMICDPPYTNSDYTIVRAQLMNPGLKENGGIFNHTQGWGVIAEAILGHGNQAYKYLRSYLPAAYNTLADVREIEPYVVCQSTHAKHSPKHGASRIPWLSGAATWMYYAITHYVLGIRPEYKGITIDPCIPSTWPGFTVTRKFRNRELSVEVKNPNHVEKGVERIEINGKTLHNTGFIPESELAMENTITIFMK